MKVYLTRRYRFSASHRLHNEALSSEENIALYKKCNNPNGHGHNYALEVTLSGEVNDDTGMVFDLKELKKLTQREIIDKVDHKNLNVDVDYLKGIIPTAENLAIKFWEILEPKITQGRLHEIKLYESERNFVVYRGSVCEPNN